MWKLIQRRGASCIASSWWCPRANHTLPDFIVVPPPNTCHSAITYYSVPAPSVLVRSPSVPGWTLLLGT